MQLRLELSCAGIDTGVDGLWSRRTFLAFVRSDIANLLGVMWERITTRRVLSDNDMVEVQLLVLDGKHLTPTPGRGPYLHCHP